MGTKTVDETGAETGAAAKNDEDKVDVTKADPKPAEAQAADGEATDVAAAEDDELFEDGDELVAGQVKEPSGVGQGAAAIVSAGIGLVSLSGSWVGTIAAEREQINGNLKMQAAANPSVATSLEALYGNAWQTTALWGGAFALVALLVGVVVLLRPAFGVPGKPQPVWIQSVSWAGISLGVIGLILAVLKYTDIWLSLPSV